MKSETKRSTALRGALLCLLCVLWVLPVPARAQGTYTLDQVLAKMSEAGKTFQSMQAAIEKTHVTVIVNDKDVTSGTVYFALKGTTPRIKMEITKPEQQLMLIDNGKVQIFAPKLKQVQEHVLGKDQNPEFMLIGFGPSNDNIKKLYDATLVGEEVVDGQKTSILELKPKSAQAKALFTTIRLWMDQSRWIPIQIKTTEGSGDYLVMKLMNIKTNVKVPESVFDLKLPRDVQVVKI